MGATSLMDYNDGLLQTITDELANTTDLQYDAQYNIVTIADNQNNQSTYRYDELGRATKITNPKGAIQNRAFDLAGRIIEVNDFDDNQIKLQYDGIDNLLKYKDDQQEVEYSYSGMWKLTKRTDQRGTTNYYYDTEEQLTKITNENGRPYIFTLDEVGNVLKEQSFDGSVKKYKRDLAGRVTQLTKASKKTVNYKYDLASRITEIMHPDGDRQSFEYNGAGQLIKATNKDAEVEFKRNQLGLISEENVGEHTITNEYNYSGRRTNLQSSLGANLNFEHDNFGNLAHLKVAQGNTQWQADYNYDSLGFELDRLLPGNLKQSFTYDAIGRLTQQQTHLNRKENKKLKHRRRYTWGKNDRLLSTNDSKQGITAYEYSPTGHLQKTTFADGKTQHRLADSVGNLYEQTNKHDRTYGAGGRLEKKGSWNYEYDKDGFLIEKYKGNQRLFSNKKEHWKYNWNNEGMLQSVNQPDGETVSFTYDALGRRLSKTFKNTVTKWLWDGNTPLHEWKESLQTGEILSNSGVDEEGIITWVFEENTFIPTAKLKGNKKYSILADQLGTPSQMYNDEGETVWERSLDSFGKPNYQTGKQGSCPFMYQGQYEDVETGLYYNRFRYYDAEDGRYISQDPIGLLSGEFGFYNYVDDSNSLIDVFGLDTVYSRKRDHKNEGNLKPYVGSAKNGVKKRYSKKELEGKDGKDHFTTPNHDITRGLEQIIFERGRDKKGKDYWDNINNPVSPSHIGGVKYKDNMDKYTYRKTKAEEFMKKKYGDNWKNKIDEAFGF